MTKDKSVQSSVKLSKLEITDKDKTYASQWPWKTQEISSIATFAVLPFVVLLGLLIFDQFSWILFGSALAIGAVASVSLYWMGSKRKKNSRFVAVLRDDSLLQVEGLIPATGKKFYSKLKLDEARSAGLKPLGINATFVIFSRDEEGKDVQLLLPYRVAMIDELRPKVIETLERIQLSAEAEDFLLRLKDEELPSNYKRELRKAQSGIEPEWKEAAKHI